MTSMPLRPIESLGYPGRTYKFYDGPTVYNFGHGLSYTQFSYAVATSTQSKSLVMKLNKYQHCHDVTYKNNMNKPSCPAVLIDGLNCDQQRLELDIVVENVGYKDGNDVVMVFSKPPQGIADTHIKQVIGFERVHVPAESNHRVKFEFDVCKSFGIVDGSGYKLLPSGWHTIMLGDGTTSYPVKISFQH